MNWLIIQSAGQHDGSDGWTQNAHLRECFALQNGIFENGYSCDIWGKRHPNFNTPPDFNSYDIIVLLENYEWEWVPDLSKFNSPLKLHWIIDLHCQNPYVDWSKQCDVVLHSTKSLIPAYEVQCPMQKHIWFPNAVDNKNFYPAPAVKKIDCCFVGSPHNRIEFISALKIPQYFKTGIDMVNTIRETKIHFNKSISSDVNYRCFETIGLGTCLLTNHIPEMTELGFKDGDNCIFYDSLEECSDKLKYYLTADRYINVAKGGEQLSKKHTYAKRISTVLGQI
jgi:spore maturation protein CgeB